MKSRKSKILTDHNKRGKKYVPKLMEYGKSNFIDWDRQTTPELIWVALVLDDLDERDGSDFLKELAGLVVRIPEKDSIQSMLLMSNIAEMNQMEKEATLDKWRDKKLLKPLVRILNPFLYYYPECPLAFILESVQPKKPELSFLVGYKSLLSELLDRNSRTAVMSVAAVIYNQFVRGKLKVPRESALANLNDVVDYPKSEKSKEVASLLRAGFKLLYAEEHYNSNAFWCEYFWDCSYRIEPIEL